jgi:hypothetical protein
MMGSYTERHYKVSELAEMWSASEDTIRRWFEDEPGVLKFGSKGERGRRRRLTLRIPESVAARVYGRMAGIAPC